MWQADTIGLDLHRDGARLPPAGFQKRSDPAAATAPGTGPNRPPTQTRARGKDPAESDLHLPLLRTQPIFGEIGRDRVRQLCACATVRKVGASATIFANGDPGAALFAVRRGSVKIVMPAIDGRGAVFNALREGESKRLSFPTFIADDS